MCHDVMLLKNEDGLLILKFIVNKKQLVTKNNSNTVNM